MPDDVNLTKGLFFLISWSVLAGVWWLIAMSLIAIGPRRQHSKSKPASASLSVFKPIPPVQGDAECQALADAIESFISQMDEEDELLIGVDPRTSPSWERVFSRWRSQWPEARIVIVSQPAPLHLANPKVAWMEVLSTQAKGEFWLWSDADVIAPPHFLRALKEALANSEANAVTASYAVRNVRKASGIFDALFVNAEFLPGAILLGRLGATDFAYGAAIMFRAATFCERVNWSDLGAQLADDHELGRRLKPVELVSPIVSTFTLPGSWSDALRHYYRWQKTVRWCRPAGYAAMIVIIPMIGWTVAMPFATGNCLVVAGFVGQWLLEVCVAIIICALADCRLPPRTWCGLLLWPLVRMLSWLGAWLPLKVTWGNEEAVWRTPTRLK